MFSPDCIVVNDSALYKLLNSDGEVKVDIGFQIKDGLLLLLLFECAT